MYIPCTSQGKSKKQIQMALVNYHGFFKFQNVPGSSCIGFATSGMNDGLRANVHHLLGGYNSNQPELVRSNKYSTSPAQAGLLRNVKLPSSGIFSVTIASYWWSLTCCCGEKQPHPPWQVSESSTSTWKMWRKGGWGKGDISMRSWAMYPPWVQPGQEPQLMPIEGLRLACLKLAMFHFCLQIMNVGMLNLLEHIFVWCTKNWVRWTRLSQKQIDEIRWFRSTTPCVVGQCVLWP